MYLSMVQPGVNDTRFTLHAASIIAMPTNELVKSTCHWDSSCRDNEATRQRIEC